MDTILSRSQRVRARYQSAIAYFGLALLQDVETLPIPASAGGGTLTIVGNLQPGVIDMTNGGIAAGFNIVLPGPFITKTLYNNTGQAATVKATGADAGVVLATGHTQAFWNDGTTMRAIATAVAN